MRFLFLMTVFVATCVNADVPTKLHADLNGNGLLEVFELIADADNIVTLMITEEGADPIEVYDFTWKGGLYGQEPELALAPNGSVHVISQNEGCCRHRWRHTVTLAYRQGAIRVAGSTYTWRDTLNLGAYGTCDMNFLTGKAVRTLGEGRPEWFEVSSTALPVSEWNLDTAPLEGCELN